MMTNLKQVREAQHMTQDELAAKLGVSRSTVAMWETDRNTPPTKQLLSLSAALNCTIEDLLQTSDR